MLIAILGCGLGLFVVPGRGRAQSPSEPLPTGRWLVDRARTYALTRANATEEEAEYILVWMQAAARVSPELAEAHLWCFDLLHRLGRTAEAIEALDAYSRLVRDDVVARLHYIELAIEECQTVDARIAFCRAQLERKDNPPVAVSDLHRRLADLHDRMGDPQTALAQARKAVEAYDRNLRARSLLLELEGREEEPVERVKLLLDAVAMNPASGGAVWELARYLDDLSLHDHAVRWYRYAIDEFRRRNPGVQPPAEVLLDLATSYTDGGKYGEAFEVCNQAMAGDPSLLAAQMLMIRIARARGLRDVAEPQRDRLAAQCLETEPTVLANRDAGTAAQLAWFYVEYKPDPARAVRLARFALGLVPGDPGLQRVLGWALLSDGEADEARSVLTPLAVSDPLAAVGLARSLLQQGRRDAAVDVLRGAQRLRASGLAYEKASAMLDELGESPAAKPDHGDVVHGLESFDSSVLSFFADPSKVLKLDVTFSQTSYEYAQPMPCAFRLTNRGTYPITLGQEGMVANPELLVTCVGLWGDAPPAEHYVSVSLLRDTVLLPGQTIVVRETLDVGAVAAILAPAPQRDAILRFSVLFDPVPTDRGEWTSRLPSMQTEPVRVSRNLVDATPKGIAKLLRSTSDPQEAQRSIALQTLAGLIAERRRALVSRLDYTAYAVDDEALERHLLAGLKDDSPIVRAHVLDALGFLAVNPKLIEAAAPLLADENWLVRLLAIDLFAAGQGPVFEPVAKHAAEADPDPLIRRLAQLYVDAWAAPPESR